MSHRFPIIDVEGPTNVELSLEQRYETVASILVHQFFQLYRLVGARYGWEAANDLAAEVPEPSVPLLVRGYQKKFGLEAEGAALLSQVMQAEFLSEGSDVAVVEEEADGAAFEVLCTFGAMLQSDKYDDVKIADGLCHRGCEGWMNEVGKTIDPPVTAVRETWMGDGAPRCRFAYSCATPPAPE
jgi:hypothetical protein